MGIRQLLDSSRWLSLFYGQASAVAIRTVGIPVPGHILLGYFSLTVSQSILATTDML
jgi:hypothetical protein